MAKNTPDPSPRTHREVVASLVLEDIDILLDKVEALRAVVDNATDKHLETIKRLESASDAYHQAVLAANLRSKKDMVAYLETMSKTHVAYTVEEQRTALQMIVRDAVGNEAATLKKMLPETSAAHRLSFKDWWGFILVVCLVTAIISSSLTVALLNMQ
jgi:Na+-transporting NADH:ubiquinone oxidoreductase subunit NqrC